MQNKTDTQSNRYLTKKYAPVIAALLFCCISISYAAGFLPGGLITSLKQFAAGEAISSTDVNQNFTKINQELLDLKTALNNAVPAGTLITYSGAVIPAEYLKCPTTAADAVTAISSYPKLYNAIGNSWGSVTSTTFTIPWFPEGYTLLQANGNVATSTRGEVISHSHPLSIWNDSTANGNGVGSRFPNSLNSSTSTAASGGPDNLAAGTKVMILVKY